MLGSPTALFNKGEMSIPMALSSEIFIDETLKIP